MYYIFDISMLRTPKIFAEFDEEFSLFGQLFSRI